MTARAFFSMPFATIGSTLRRIRLDWQIRACGRDLDLTGREVREKLDAQRQLTRQLINLQNQRAAL